MGSIKRALIIVGIAVAGLVVLSVILGVAFGQKTPNAAGRGATTTTTTTSPPRSTTTTTMPKSAVGKARLACADFDVLLERMYHGRVFALTAERLMGPVISLSTAADEEAQGGWHKLAVDAANLAAFIDSSRWFQHGSVMSNAVVAVQKDCGL